MREGSDRHRYIRLLLYWMDRGEKLLVKGLFIAAALMIAAQILLRIPFVREAWSETDKLEGEPVLRDETSR
ncbi:hypothetical protein DUZ99_10690 [Xylanibacillus composti]|uniref:Uncharacterized protein n=1 Tax=Xylanibacillus composti TaxID=1572762 RepID=A0A8J4M4C6_9BACL|nr:hypothetical protein [Xylanibacillus composti]MDT9725437.1 hypothetical protein [Xylanibacillus composti]GIQ71047.1 hypothetical protein XYCOK13_38710 [Xylanibacillus composti]